MGPSQWRDVRQKAWRTVETSTLSGGDGMAKVLAIPVDDDRGQQVQPGHAIVLSLRGSVSDFALATDTEGVFQRMMCLTFVQADLCAALHVGVQQPIDNEQGALNPPDLSQGYGQFVLTGI